MGQQCEHRTALLLEDPSAAIDVGLNDVRSLSQRTKASPLGDTMRVIFDLKAGRIKKKVTAQKEVITRILNGEAPLKAAYAARY